MFTKTFIYSHKHLCIVQLCKKWNYGVVLRPLKSYINASYFYFMIRNFEIYASNEFLDIIRNNSDAGYLCKPVFQKLLEKVGQEEVGELSIQETEAVKMYDGDEDAKPQVNLLKQWRRCGAIMTCGYMTWVEKRVMGVSDCFEIGKSKRRNRRTRGRFK